MPHFSTAEFADRGARLRAEMAARDLDAMLLFAPESQYWLTGYDTFGFAAFQCMVATSDGRVVLLTRAPDRWTAEYTSNVDDVRIWTDVEGMNPAADLRGLMADLGLEGGRVGALDNAAGKPYVVLVFPDPPGRPQDLSCCGVRTGDDPVFIVLTSVPAS